MNVKDVPAEMWLRIIAGLLVIMTSMGGYFGNRIIVSIDKIQDRLLVLNEDHPVIIRNTQDIKDLQKDQAHIHDQIYTINGELHNWRDNGKKTK